MLFFLFCDFYTIPHYLLLFNSVFLFLCYVSCILWMTFTKNCNSSTCIKKLSIEYWVWLRHLPVMFLRPGAVAMRRTTREVAPWGPNRSFSATKGWFTPPKCAPSFTDNRAFTCIKKIINYILSNKVLKKGVFYFYWCNYKRIHSTNHLVHNKYFPLIFRFIILYKRILFILRIYLSTKWIHKSYNYKHTIA